jgi:hypothetical protein
LARERGEIQFKVNLSRSNTEIISSEIIPMVKQMQASNAWEERYAACKATISLLKMAEGAHPDKNLFEELCND